MTRPDQPKPKLSARVQRWFDEKLQSVGDAVPWWMSCCGSDVMWDMVDSELAFQEAVEEEHGVVYGDGSEASLAVLLAEHGEVGYTLRAADIESPPAADVPSTASVVTPEVPGLAPSEPQEGVSGPSEAVAGAGVIVFGDVEVPVEDSIAFGSIVVPVEHEVAAAVAEATKQCRGLREATAEPPAEEVVNQVGKREWRRKQAVVSAPIVSKVVAEMRAEVGVCCASCDHADIAAVRRDCPANYQAAQWTCLRIMKDRGLHAEHVQLYLLPCLVAYFHRIQFADGLGGYTGSLGVARRRIWRRRHRQVA